MEAQVAWLTCPVQKEKCGEVGCVEGMQEEHKLGTVESVDVGEPTAWEYAQLEELGDGPVLQDLCRGRNITQCSSPLPLTPPAACSLG